MRGVLSALPFLFLILMASNGAADIDMTLTAFGNTPTEPNQATSPLNARSIYTGGDVKVTIDWEEGNTLERVTVDNCDGDRVYSWEGNVYAPFEGIEFEEPFDSFCGLGRNSYTVYADFTGTGVLDQKEFTITTYPKGTDDLNFGNDYGEKLIVNLRPGEGNPSLRAFQLTNDEQLTDKTPFSGDFNQKDIYAQAKCGGLFNCFLDGSKQNSYEVEPGTIISQDESLEPLLKNSCSGGKVCNDVIKQPFVNNDIAVAAVWKNLNSIYPIHDKDKYKPVGEIAYAYLPDGDKPYFFVCTDKKQVVNSEGNPVPRVINLDKDNQELAQCNTETNEWEVDSIGECNDGLDNDGDGKIDHPDSEFSTDNPDPGCTSQTAEETDASPETEDCTPAVGYDGTDYIAYYGGNPDDDGYCDGSNGNQETFDDWTGSFYTDPDRNVPSPLVITCDENAATGYCEHRDFYRHDEDTSSSGAQVNYVQYYPTTEYLRDGINIGSQSGLETGQKGESYFVNDEGWTSARMSLDASNFAGSGTKPNERKGAERIYGTAGARHSDSYWFGTKAMVDGDGNGYRDGSYDDSWVVANAGAPNNDQISVKFPGGYAGKCPQGTEWKKVGSEWQCSGEPEWRQAVFLPKITEGTNRIGLLVMPYNFKDEDTEPTSVVNLGLSSWKTAYGDVADNTATSSQNLEEMKVSCYPGENVPDYSSATEGEDYFNETVNIQTDVENPVGVNGTVDMAGHTTYTCEWSYNTVGSEPGVVDRIGCVIELQKTESQCAEDDEEFTSIKDHFMNKEFSDGTSLERDYKYSSNELTDLMG